MTQDGKFLRMCRCVSPCGCMDAVFVCSVSPKGKENSQPDAKRGRGCQMQDLINQQIIFICKVFLKMAQKGEGSQAKPLNKG